MAMRVNWWFTCRHVNRSTCSRWNMDQCEHGLTSGQKLDVLMTKVIDLVVGKGYGRLGRVRK